MRPRSLLVLLAAVLALGAFIWFFERELPGSEEREAQAKRLVPGLEVDEVAAFEVESGGERVRIERVEPPAGAGTGEEEDAADDAAAEAAADDPFGAPPEPAAEWRIVAPQRWAGARADRVAVEGLLSAVAAVEKTRTLEDFDRAALGLDEPRARLTLDHAGRPIVLAAGADVPASSDMVVLREDTGEAHLVDRTLLQDMSRPAGDWRSRQMVAARREAVRRITLAGGAGGPVVLARGEDGGAFRIVRPLADVADPDAVDELLAALVGLTAERFVDAEDAAPAALGLEPPRARVRAETGEGQPAVEVAIGAPRPEGDGHTFRVGHQLFVAESALADLVVRPPRAWQSPALTALELYRVDEVRVEGPAGPLHLERAGGDWRRNGDTISYTPVSDLLFALVEARAEEVVPRAAAGALGEPELTIELVADAAVAGDAEEGAADEADEASEAAAPAPPAAERATIAFHPPADGLVPVTVSGRSVVLRLPQVAVDAIRAHLATVRTAEVVTANAGEEIPEGVEVEREEGL